ncbi:hypothetical protein RQP46_009265 [Phenoliferia psychrophenolica]
MSKRAPFCDGCLKHGGALEGIKLLQCGRCNCDSQCQAHVDGIASDKSFETTHPREVDAKRRFDAFLENIFEDLEICARVALEVGRPPHLARTRAVMMRFRQVKATGDVRYQFELERGELSSFSDILKEYPNADVSPAALVKQMGRMRSNVQATAIVTEGRLEDGTLIGHSIVPFELNMEPFPKDPEWQRTFREVVKRPYLESLEQQISVWLGIAGNLDVHFGTKEGTMTEQGKGFFQAHGFWDLIK